MSRTTVNGLEVFYESNGEGMPFLFIHGGYGGATTTVVPRVPEAQAILPRDSVRTITYDRRNCGQSQYTNAHYTIGDLAADALGLLDTLGIDRAIICGSSAGGPIAIQAALSAPERVIGLNLSNTGANLASPERPIGQQRRAWVEQAAKDGDAAVFEARKSTLRDAPPLPANPQPDDAARLERLKLMLTYTADEALMRYATGELRNYEAYLDVDLTPRLGELNMPVSIIHGTSDKTVPFAWGEALHRAIPQSEFTPVEGADHGVLSYEPAAEALRRWVSKLIAG